MIIIIIISSSINGSRNMQLLLVSKYIIHQTVHMNHVISL